jgi:hypothetical protein
MDWRCGSRAKSWVQTSPKRKKNKQGVVVRVYNPSYMGDIGRRILIWCQPGQKDRDPSWRKLKKAKRTGGMPQVVKCLLGKSKTLSSDPGTFKNKRKPHILASVCMWVTAGSGWPVDPVVHAK